MPRHFAFAVGLAVFNMQKKRKQFEPPSMTPASMAKVLAASAPTPASDVLQHQLAVAELLQGQLGVGPMGSKLFQERFTDSVQACISNITHNPHALSKASLTTLTELMGRCDRTCPQFTQYVHCFPVLCYFFWSSLSTAEEVKMHA